MNDRVPEYIHLDGDLGTDDIRVLLDELDKRGASRETVELFACLSVVHPHYRLALNLKKGVNILAEQRVTDVLVDGLTESEAAALVELDRRHYSDWARAAARALLNVKERWFLAKALGGFFTKSRASNAFIDLGTTGADDDTV